MAHPRRRPETEDLKSASVAVGVDWSPSTLGAAAITAENLDGSSSDYQGWTYDDRGLGIKLARLQAGGQMLHRKAARLTQLAATALLEVRAQLEEMIAVLDAHRTAVGAESGEINRELEFHFAHQVTDYAAAGTDGPTTTGPRSPPAATVAALAYRRRRRKHVPASQASVWDTVRPPPLTVAALHPPPPS
ncbi:hypothetical protein [Rhodococcus sp. 3A]|uniref:hypothetical protein n=1 Tax=Rhodococcus sp. 3A TaxID=2834581 RepID=UPI0037CBC98C